MKIENNSSLRNLVLTATTYFVVLGLFPFANVAAYAADIPIPAGVPAPQVVQAAVPAAPTAPQAVLSLTDPVKAPSDEMRKSVSAMEDKATENAKNLVKHLDAAGDATTFADLNSARQAVTRIEAMIDVEKHLAELEKLRGERGGSGSHSSVVSLSTAIPASALTPPPQMHLSPEKVAVGPEAVSHGRPEISRIYGTDGKYTAVLKLPGGETKSVRVGDQLSNGEAVSSISASSVGVEGKGASYALHIKNVDAIYSAMR